MPEIKSRKSGVEEFNRANSPVIDGELPNEYQTIDADLILAEIQESKIEIANDERQKTKSEKGNQTSFLRYIVLPLIFLTVALLGGLRVDAADNAFLFLKPPLICLIFAVLLPVLFFRAGLIRLNGWFSEKFAPTKNAANFCVLLTLFVASAQTFNSLLPEKGLPFWVVAFCFFWTLWNNLFAEFDARRLVQSLIGMFALAFVVKYFVLASFAAPASKSWIQGIFENPAQEAFTWLLDLPRFAAATGYIQFFALVFYLVGLFLIKPDLSEND